MVTGSTTSSAGSRRQPARGVAVGWQPSRAPSATALQCSSHTSGLSS